MGFDFEGGGSAVGSQLGPEQNIFGIGTTVTTAPGYTADKAAAETLRDAYATANAAWLALYTGDRSFYIRLIWTGNATAFQRRDAAGTGWEDVSRIVPGDWHDWRGWSGWTYPDRNTDRGPAGCVHRERALAVQAHRV